MFCDTLTLKSDSSGINNLFDSWKSWKTRHVTKWYYIKYTLKVCFIANANEYKFIFCILFFSLIFFQTIIVLSLYLDR